MSTRVKGITVEIGGDTGPLSKSLKGIEDEIKNTEKTLRDVNKLLKLDPTNTELLAQKQNLLQKEIGETEKKLEALKDADKQAKEQLESGDLGKEEYAALQREIVETENKLKNLKNTVGSSSSSLAKASAVTEKFGNKSKDLGSSLLPATAALTGAGAASVSMANDFEDSMSQAAGALNKPMAEMEDLRKLAIQTGQDTVFSATDAGNAITELAKGGLTEADIKAGALQATMDLAASSGMELGDAANVVVQAMGAFGLSAEDAALAANALAGAAAASSTDVEPLTQGLAQCSAQAKNAGWDIQETTAVLGRFADAGIVGSDAGTSLKTMLQRLAAPTDKAAATIETLGINTRDSSGNLLGASEMAEELQNKLGGLDSATRDAALQTIFGSDATRAATVLMNSGAEGLQKYIDATNDQESAQRLANSQMSETSRAIENMKGSLETAAITIGDTLAPIIQKAAEFISDLASKFSSLPEGMQTAIVMIGVLVAALGPALMMIGQISLGISSLTGVFSKVATGSKFINMITTAVKGLFSVIAANPVIAIITAIIAALVLLYTKCEWFRNGVNSIISAIVGFFQNLGQNLQDIFSSIVTAIQNAWETIKNAVSTAMGTVQSIIEAAWTAILNNPVVQAIVTTVSALFENMKNTMSNIWDNINSAAQAAWELIKNVILGPVLLLIDLVLGDFGQMKSDAQNIWNNIKNAASTIWNSIMGVVSSIAEGMANAVKISLDGLRAVVSGIWDAMKNAASTAWNAIRSTVSSVASSAKDMAVNAFRTMVSGIANALSAIGSTVRNGFQSAIDFIRNLPGQAVKWGSDFIDGLKNGITSGINSIVEAVEGLADKIRSFLHFSRPDEGPLRDYEKWMPDMMEGLSAGITKNIPKLQKAAQRAAGIINTTMHGVENGVAGQSARQTMIVVNGDSIVLDGKEIGKSATKYINVQQAGNAAAKGARLRYV